MESISERSRKLRYKRPALSSMGWEAIHGELENINEACDEVRYRIDADDGETLINALDGDSDQADEFKMMFCDMSSRCEQLYSALDDCCEDTEEYDDCTVALIGNQYRVVGYDTYEEDYYALASYDSELAQTESGKRIMRKTKAEMISTIGQCVGIMLAFYDLRQQYDYLKATMDIIRDENTSYLQSIAEINELYEAAAAEGFCPYRGAGEKFEKLLDATPERMWIE